MLLCFIKVYLKLFQHRVVLQRQVTIAGYEALKKEARNKRWTDLERCCACRAPEVLGRASWCLSIYWSEAAQPAQCPTLQRRPAWVLPASGVCWGKPQWSSAPRWEAKLAFTRCGNWWRGLPRWLSGKESTLPMQETWVRSLGWEDLLEEGVETHSSIQYSYLEDSMDRGAWWGTIHGTARVGHDWVTE